ncbi:hypothetical protein [Arthrobacter psychrolactophilus]
MRLLAGADQTQTASVSTDCSQATKAIESLAEALGSGNAEDDDRYAIPSWERAGEAYRMERIRDRMGMSSLLIYSMFAELRELKIRGGYAGLLVVLGGKVLAPRIDFAP